MKSPLTLEQIEFLRNTGVPHLIELAEKSENPWLNKFITRNPEMIELKEDIRKLMHEDDPVLIIGESGTGKELIANALHNSKEGTFVAVNCAGMPEQLIESELFGHVKGAFTGADKDKKGLFEEAVDGTIFLDEIGELPFGVQAKLLRVIQERKVRKVGSNIETRISVRLVCATHKAIDKPDCNFFRRDLYYRISTFILRPTPLRDRPEDIELILKNLDTEKKLPAIIIQNLDTTGNVRSLQYLVRRYYVLGKI